MAKTTEILVRDMMGAVDTVREDTTIEGALDILKKEKLVLLPVIGKDNVLVGVLTEHDLMKLIKQELPSIAGTAWSESIDSSVRDKPIKEIMTTKIISVSPNDTVDSALKMMNNNSMRVLLVVDSDGKLSGMIRIRDVFEKLLKG